jgi:Peptidase family S41/N-terminal domain of Peptidase_S41 in eukaryotic IRBP
MSRTVSCVVWATILIGSGICSRPLYSKPNASDESRVLRGNATRRQIIGTLADKLEAKYVIPEVGARYARMLREKSVKGAYDEITDREAFAARLTKDLQAVAPDGHLRVRANSNRPSPRHRPEIQPTGERPADDKGMGGPGPQPLPAVQDAKWAAEGVAYIRFNEFPDDAETAASVDRFMKEHASAKALIIDARTCRGGGIEEMKVILPNLYAEETVLVAMDLSAALVAKEGPPPDETPTLRDVPGPTGVFRREHVVMPHPTEHRLFTAKVFYLTSKRTASAAEHMALALKRTHRALLVGDATAGANHFGDFEEIGGGYSAFIPVGRTIDPETGEDWEGDGIQPDVPVPPEEAIDAAMRLAQAER